MALSSLNIHGLYISRITYVFFGVFTLRLYSLVVERRTCYQMIAGFNPSWGNQQFQSLSSTATNTCWK